MVEMTEILTMCHIHSSKCECPGDGDLYDWLWRICEIHFSKCDCPGGYDGDPKYSLIHFSLCKCHGDYDGDPYNVFDIHFSKCECPGGYNGDPYNWSWRMCEIHFS